MPHRHQPPSTGAVIFVLAYCGGLVSVTGSFALPLLHDLPHLLNASISDVSWVSTAALLSGAVSTPVLGRIGDMYGKRKVMQLNLLLLTVGSIVCALATSVWVLVAGRAMQGMSLAVLPIAMALAKDLLPPAKLNSGIALVSAMLGIGGGLALPLAGVMLDLWGWHSAFWLSALLAVFGMVVTAKVIPAVAPGEREPFDVVGALLLSVVLVALLLPLSKSSSWGFLQPKPLACYAIGAVGLLAWFRYEQHPPVPLVNLHLMRQRPLLLTNIAGVLLGFGMFGNSFITLFLLQAPKDVSHGFDMSVMGAGLVMLPAAMAIMFMAPVSAKLTNRYGARMTLWTGAAGMGLSFVTRPFLVGSPFLVGLGAVLVSCGIGIAYGAMPAVVMSYVPISENSSANAMGTLGRSLGASINSAAFAALLSSLTVLHDGDDVARLVAFQIAFGLSAVAALVAAGLAFSLPRHSALALTSD